MLGKGLESLIPSGTKKPDNNQYQAGLVYQDYAQPAVNTQSNLPGQIGTSASGVNNPYLNQGVTQNNYPPFPPVSGSEPPLTNPQAPVVGGGLSAFLSGGNQGSNLYPAQATRPEVGAPEVYQEKAVYQPENAYRKDFYQEPVKYADYDKNSNYGELSARPASETANQPYGVQLPVATKGEAVAQPTPYAAPVYNPLQVTAPITQADHSYAGDSQQMGGMMANGKEDDYSNIQGSVFQIEVDKIFPNPHQPRRYFDEAALSDLASSIREFGIIQPLVVTKIIQPTETGEDVTYQLIAGERRLQAAKKIGLRTVPAVIKQITMDRERLELAIIENVQREDLNPLETARSFARLQDEFGLTQREIAIRMGKSRETVANTLRLLNLSTEIQQAIESGKINESHARILLQVTDPKQQQEMFESIIRFKPTVRELKARMRYGKTGASQGFGFSGVNPELVAFQSRLEEVLGTKVQIVNDGEKGKITINYYSAEELSDLINRLSGGRNLN